MQKIYTVDLITDVFNSFAYEEESEARETYSSLERMASSGLLPGVRIRLARAEAPDSEADIERFVELEQYPR